MLYCMMWLYIKGTVRLLTHVLCKPTHFFFHSFIATISYSLQISFNSVMKDWADKYHVWGTPRGHLQGQTRDSSSTRIFTLKRNKYTCVLKSTPFFYRVKHTKFVLIVKRNTVPCRIFRGISF